MTEAQKRANEKYHAKMEEIKIRVPKGKKDEYKQKAKDKNQSLQQYIVSLIEDDK